LISVVEGVRYFRISGAVREDLRGDALASSVLFSVAHTLGAGVQPLTLVLFLGLAARA